MKRLRSKLMSKMVRATGRGQDLWVTRFALWWALGGMGRLTWTLGPQANSVIVIRFLSTGDSALFLREVNDLAPNVQESECQ